MAMPTTTSATPAITRTRPTRSSRDELNDERVRAANLERSGPDDCRQMSAAPSTASPTGGMSPARGTVRASTPMHTTATIAASAYSRTTALRGRDGVGAVGRTT